MKFSINHPILFLIAGVLVAVVLAQSIYFLAKALKRSKQLGMDQKKIRKTIISAAVFTIAPAVAIVISVMVLSKTLGLPLPWLRLSVVGSMSYETIAANNTLSAMGQSLGSGSLNAQQFVNVLTVMTVSIMLGIWLVPLIGKRLQKGMKTLANRDQKWADTFQSALFIGMIAAFLGFVFCDVSSLWRADYAGLATPTAGLIPAYVMVISALVMLLCGLLMKLPKMKWLSEYALPISLIAGMASAIPITNWLG